MAYFVETSGEIEGQPGSQQSPVESERDPALVAWIKEYKLGPIEDKLFAEELTLDFLLAQSEADLEQIVNELKIASFTQRKKLLYAVHQQKNKANVKKQSESDNEHKSQVVKNEKQWKELGDKFDANRKGQKVLFVADSEQRAIYVKKEFIWTTACTKREISSGIHQWQFVIEEYHGEKGRNGWHLLIGICKTNNINKHLNYFYEIEPNMGYAYVLSDGLLSDLGKGASAGKDYGIVLKANDIPCTVTMIVDLDAQTVSYVVNGTDYGVAFGNIDKTTYVAALSFMPFLGQQRIKCVSYKVCA